MFLYSLLAVQLKNLCLLELFPLILSSFTFLFGLVQACLEYPKVYQSLLTFLPPSGSIHRHLFHHLGLGGVLFSCAYAAPTIEGSWAGAQALGCQSSPQELLNTLHWLLTAQVKLPPNK